MLGRDLTKQKDNSYVPLNIASRSIIEVKSDAVATSIAGTWFSPMSSFTAYMGAAGKFARNDEARKVAKEMSDGKSTTQKDCIPIGLPATMFYPVATTIAVQKDKVIIKTDWMDTTRTVYLDKPPAPARQPEVPAWPFSRPLGRKNAGRRDDELHRTSDGPVDRRAEQRPEETH